MSKTDMVVILGPTACGKTDFAAHLALQLGGEIISADSRQVYRGMTIGTGKDLDDYIIDNKHILIFAMHTPTSLNAASCL